MSSRSVRVGFSRKMKGVCYVDFLIDVNFVEVFWYGILNEELLKEVKIEEEGREGKGKKK